MLNNLNKIFSSLSPARLFLVALAIITTFWYLNIFLFDRQLISNERFYVPFVIAFCLSFLWCALTCLLSFTLFKKPQNHIQQLYPEQEQLLDHNWSHTCFFWNIFV